MDFKNGETITDYKMSGKGDNSNRQPVERFIDQLIVEEPKKDKREFKNSKKKDK